MVGSLDPVGGGFQFAGMGFGIFHQILQAVEFAVLPDHHNPGFLQMVADGNDALVIKGSILGQSQGGVGGQVDEADGVAVGFGLGQFRPADLSVCTRFVFNDQSLSHEFFRILAQYPGTGIRTGSCLVGYDDFDVLGGFPVIGRLLGFLAAAGTYCQSQGTDGGRSQPLFEFHTNRPPL